MTPALKSKLAIGTLVFATFAALSAGRSKIAPNTDYVEITTELKSAWKSKNKTNHHATEATCVVGDKTWFISGNFLNNAEAEYWLVGTNVVERRTIHGNKYFEQAKEFVSEKILRRPPASRFSTNRNGPILLRPRAGEVSTIVHPSPRGQPAGEGSANLVWLAFCSGPYLKYPGRQVPMPLGPPSQAFGFRDQTVEFNDVLGLPKTVELYAADGRAVCEYKVLQATNFFGRSFPLKFRLVQQRRAGGAKTELVGRVTSIRIGAEPKLPADVRKKLEQ
jgi:hypothetical protein